VSVMAIAPPTPTPPKSHRTGTSSLENPPPPSDDVRARSLRLPSATALVIGSIIGTGVFTMPAVLGAGTLPALHERSTQLGQRLHDPYGLDGAEVTDEVFESPASVVSALSREA
jgi:hypothetical protein